MFWHYFHFFFSTDAYLFRINQSVNFYTSTDLIYFSSYHKYIGRLDISAEEKEASADDWEDKNINCSGSLYIIWNSFGNNFDVMNEFSNCRN